MKGFFDFNLKSGDHCIKIYEFGVEVSKIRVNKVI